MSFCRICSPCNSFGRVLDRCRTTLSSSMTFEGNLLSGSKGALPFLSSAFPEFFKPLRHLCCPRKTSASVSSRQLKLRCFLARLRSLSSLCSRQWATMEALSFQVPSPGSWSPFSLSRSFSSSALALSIFLRASVAFLSCWMGIRGKPPILGFLVIERFRSFPAGGRISFSCWAMKTLAIQSIWVCELSQHRCQWCFSEYAVNPQLVGGFIFFFTPR